MRSQIETIDGTTKTTEDITYSADENISGQTTTIQNLEIENEQSLFKQIKSKFNKNKTTLNFDEYVNSNTEKINLGETLNFYNNNGLCKCDLTTYKPFIEDRDFTIQYQMPGIAYLQQSPNHSWNMSLLEYKTEKTLPKNNVENYITTPPIDNTTYTSINHISSNINGKSNNQTIVYGNELLFSESISETTNYILNGQNNVIHEQINNKVIDYQYDAYGQQLSTSPNPTFGYNSEYQINNSTQYLRARTYDNSTGRMMQYDTYQGGLNPLSRNHYTYAHNNPVNLEDPSGNAIKKIISVGGIIYGLTVKAKDQCGKNKACKFVYEFNNKIQTDYGASTGHIVGVAIQSTDVYILANEFSKPYGYYTQWRTNVKKFERHEYSDYFEIDTQEMYIYFDTLRTEMIKELKLVNWNQYREGELIANIEYNTFLRMMSWELLEKNNSNSVPSIKEEPYWVPIYISHGNNEVKYV